MIKVGDHVSWTHVINRGSTMSMSLREGVVEDIGTEREPRDWFHDKLVNMDGRELVIRATTMHDDTDWDYLVVARSQNDDDLDIPVFDGSEHECKQYVDECSPYATVKKKRGSERIAVARLRVKGQKSQISELVEAVNEN